MTRRSRLPLLLTVSVFLAVGAGATATYYVQGWSGAVRPEVVAEGIAARLAAAEAGAFRIGEAAVALHAGTAAVYQGRQHLPAWLNPEARAVALGLLREADRDGLRPDSFGVDRVGALAAAAAWTDSTAADLDLLLTDAVLRLGDALVGPAVDAHALYGNAWFPTHRTAAVGPSLAEALAAADPPAAVAAWADALRPAHPQARALRQALAREVALRDRPDLALGTDLAPGDTGRAVLHLRERLALDGAAPGAERPETYDGPLSEAVRAAQARHALPATGSLDAATRAALNRRQPDLIPLLTLNVERWRWLPDDWGDLHIEVNIPGFEIAVVERDGEAWAERLRTRAVVGTDGWETPVFSDTMETIVFNPTWTIPASIQRQSYGRVVGRMVRPPGPGNALGRAKFLFPNDHAVYIHDTPSKWAFGREVRALSHGCVRSGDPRALATALLTRTNGWEAGRVDAIWSGRWRLQSVELDRPVPVHLVYLTAWVDAAGQVQVLDDVYGYDGRLANAMGLDLPPSPANPA